MKVTLCEKIQKVLDSGASSHPELMQECLDYIKSQEEQQPAAWLPFDVYGKAGDPITIKQHDNYDDPNCFGEYWGGDKPLYLRPLPMKQIEANKGSLAVWFGSMPESNGRENWTAILYRKDDPDFDIYVDGFTFYRSEYKDRARYTADEVRYIIGELKEKPFILNYDADLHSGHKDE